MTNRRYFQTQDPAEPQKDPPQPTGPTDPNPTNPVPGEPNPYPVTDPIPGEPPPVPTPPEPIPQFPPDVTFRVVASEKVKDRDEGDAGDGHPKYHALKQRPVPEFFYRIM